MVAPFGRFLVPGPTEVRSEILDAMTRPMISHRSDEFRALFHRVRAGLRQIFRTEHDIVIATCSGTGLMEAAVRNAPSGQLLALVNGHFSDRFARTAEACGRYVDRYEVPWGQTHDPDIVAARLSANRASAVLVVHSETSTGALNDVRSISDVAHRHGALACIDSVSGLRGAALEFDAWDLDYVFTASQKALALPPGLAFAAVSERFQRVGSHSGRGLYFDLSAMIDQAAKNEPPQTPALPIYFALDRQLQSVLAEGLPAAWLRHREMSEITCRWVESVARATGLGYSVLAPPTHRSPTVTAMVLPAPVAASRVLEKAAALGYTVGRGVGDLRVSTVRIGHMGDHTPESVARALEALTGCFAAD